MKILTMKSNKTYDSHVPISYSDRVGRLQYDMGRHRTSKMFEILLAAAIAD